MTRPVDRCGRHLQNRPRNRRNECEALATARRRQSERCQTTLGSLQLRLPTSALAIGHQNGAPRDLLPADDGYRPNPAADRGADVGVNPPHRCHCLDARDGPRVRRRELARPRAP